jgi:hypothetical protein
MESDSIRASGSNTLVEIWVNGKIRAISVTRQAIEAFGGPSASGEMSDDERCEFVRTHLPLVVTAVKAQLREASGDLETVTIDIGQLGGRVADRRKGERRKAAVAKEKLPHGERRRGDRRKNDRRSR